jgi:2-methylcitrate dehydratase
MTACEELARWAVNASWKHASKAAQQRIKLHLLDALACAIGALGAAPLKAIRNEEQSSHALGTCTTIAGESTSPERAAFYNGALIRYLDFMDTFVAPGEACHPSDNIAVVLAGAELAGASGKDLLTALLVAYQVQCEMTDAGVPIMKSGFDHTIQLAISQTAGLCRVLGLSQQQAAHAIGISTANGLGLAVSRAGNPVPQWKGMASAATAFSTIHNTRLAERGITGPLDAFESPLGLERVLGGHFKINWSRQKLDKVLSCNIKRYNAEFHSQTCVDALLELRREHGIQADEIRAIKIDIFKVAYEMIGGGKYVDPKSMKTKEDADHSLHYLAAVALLDGEVGPRQFEAARVRSSDVQDLLRRVNVASSYWYTKQYPRNMKCKVRVMLKDGRTLIAKKKDFRGFHRTPMKVDDVSAKFESLASGLMSAERRNALRECVLDLENRSARELMQILSGAAAVETLQRGELPRAA